MALRTSLQRRKSGQYYLRKKVPVALKPIIGKYEVVKSLGTKDPLEATKRVLSVEQEIEAMFEGIRQGKEAVFTKEITVHNTCYIIDMPQNKVKPAPTPKAYTLYETFERWTKDGDKSKTYIGEANLAVRQFIDLHGDLPINAIEKTHIKQFLEAIEYVGRVHKTLYSKPLPELITAIKNKEIENTPLAPKTIEKRIDCIKSILKFAVDEDFISVNPATDIKIKANNSAPEIERLPYSPDDLVRIFNSPLYTGFLSETRRHEPGKEFYKDAKFWLPLIGLFSGARLEEMGQLLISDIKKEGNVWYFDIKKGEGKKVKTKDSNRKIPIHNEIIRCGFLEYLESLKSKEEKHLFPDLDHTGKFRKTKAFSQWYKRYKTHIGIDNKEKVFHSFRHTFKDACRNANLDKEIHDRLTGHKGKDVGYSYGVGHSVAVLNTHLQKITYPNLNLNHLYIKDFTESDLNPSNNDTSTASNTPAISNENTVKAVLEAIPAPGNAMEYLRLVDVFIRLGQAEYTNWKLYHIGYQKEGKWYELDLKPYFRKTGEESKRINASQLEMILSNSKPLEAFSEESEMYDHIHIEVGKYLQSRKLDAVLQDKQTGKYYKPENWRMDYTIEEILLSEISGANNSYYVLVEPKSVEQIHVNVGE